MSTNDQPKRPRPRKTESIRAYYVINQEHLSDLQNRVLELTREGWKPQGGLTRYGPRFYQAMVLPE
jgi:hypothetical protein